MAQWAGCSQILCPLSGGRHRATQVPTVPVRLLSGTFLHAYRVDTAAGCMPRTCKVVVTEHSAEVS